MRQLGIHRSAQTPCIFALGLAIRPGIRSHVCYDQLWRASLMVYQHAACIIIQLFTPYHQPHCMSVVCCIFNLSRRRHVPSSRWRMSTAGLRAGSWSCWAMAMASPLRLAPSAAMQTGRELMWCLQERCRSGRASQLWQQHMMVRQPGC